MKFSFKIQQYQTDAVDAVARVFQGQPYNAGVSYLRDMGNLSAQPQQLSLVSNGDDATQVELLDLINDSGFKNEALQLTDQELLQNIRALQAEANIRIHKCQKINLIRSKNGIGKQIEMCIRDSFRYNLI